MHRRLLAAMCASVAIGCIQTRPDPASATAAAIDQIAHVACSVPASEVPATILDMPVARRTGTGGARERVAASSTEAQAFYDQGLDYLHGYVWIEAARSFKQALRLDPALAMAWIGLSRAASGLENPGLARRALDEARALTVTAPADRERIELRTLQLDAIDRLGDREAHARYEDALDAALERDPTSVELWLLRGNAAEPTAAGRGQRGKAQSVFYYRRALALDSRSAAAHHYLTHSYENLGQIHRALEHGRMFAALAPSIPHAHHMYGHDLRRVGRVDEAIAQFVETDRLERAYYAAELIPAAYDWHHEHNLDLLAACYQHQGRMREAEAVMREMTSHKPLNDYAGFQRKLVPLFYIARGRIDEALAVAHEMTQAPWPATRTIGYASAAYAQLAIGRADGALVDLQAAEASLGTIPTLGAGLTVVRDSCAPYVTAARAEYELRAGDRDRGEQALRALVPVLRAQPGPDAWIQVLYRLEALARAARETGALDLAAFLADEMLAHDRHYAGAHLARAAASSALGDHDRAARELDEARRLWHNADPEQQAQLESSTITTATLAD